MNENLLITCTDQHINNFLIADFMRQIIKCLFVGYGLKCKEKNVYQTAEYCFWLDCEMWVESLENFLWHTKTHFDVLVDTNVYNAFRTNLIVVRI